MGDLIDGTLIEMRIANAPTRTVPVTGIQSFVGVSTGINIAPKIVTSGQEFGTGASTRGEESINTGYAWTVPFQGNVRYTGAGAAAVDLVRNASVSGAEVYVWVYPLGLGAGKPKRAGFAVVQDFSETLPSDGFITVGFTLKGLVVIDMANQT